MTLDRHLQLAEEARGLAEQRGQRRLLCSSHESLALWALNVLDTERAARHIDETEAVAREIGQALILASVPLLRARLALIVGDEAAAMALALEGETQQRRLGGRAMLGECLTLRAHLLARGGEPAAARELLSEAIQIYAGIGDDAEARACRLRTADIWRIEGRLDQAQALVEAELPFLGEVGASSRIRSEDAMSTLQHSPTATDPAPVIALHCSGAGAAQWRQLGAFSTRAMT